MGSKASTNYEETVHYDGEAVVRFYPGAHYYAVTDNGYTDPKTGKKKPLVAQRMGGGTSITGVMAKGQGLMLWPMYEMKKYLKAWARTHTLEEILDSPLNWEDILKEGTRAHTNKSDRGKSVGTDAHAWVELYLRELLRVQDIHGVTAPGITQFVQGAMDADFVTPPIPEVEEIALTLRKSYIAIYKALQPKDIDAYKKLPRLLFQDAEMQEALWTEASMLQRSTTAAKEWLEMHTIFVHGTEDTVYSRKYQICGKYDGDLSVTCTKKCNWCWRNGNMNIPGEDFTGRYIEDFKSTNASTDAPKGIYPEYLAQCGVYDLAKTEEFPDIEYDGHLILNGSKNELVDKDGEPLLDKNKQPLRPFNTHFSFNRDVNVEWAKRLSGVKEDMYRARKEIEASA